LIPTNPRGDTPGTGNVLAQDSFQRPNQTFWGTASDGHVWAGDANSQSLFSIAGQSGQIASGTGPVNAVLGPAAGDAEVLVSGSLSAFGGNNLGSVLRWSDTNHWYKAYLDGANLVLQADIAGTRTILAQAAFPAAVNTAYSLRFRVVGTTLSARAWPVAGGSEPTAWLVTATNSSLTSGQTGLRAQVLNGASARFTSFLATAA
jgi:hypothetical protein